MARHKSKTTGMKKNIKNEKLSIRAAARALGVDWGHLRRVLIGERKSRSLMKRYRALVKGGTR